MKRNGDCKNGEHILKYSLKRMYQQAHNFQLAAERCLEDKEDGYLPIQAVVCYAFACEIYLKAIYMWDNPEKEVRGHYT